eukprot:scaffold307_cov162-Amphora_coffeaeformis.AAC.14
MLLNHDIAGIPVLRLQNSGIIERPRLGLSNGLSGPHGRPRRGTPIEQKRHGRFSVLQQALHGGM